MGLGSPPTIPAQSRNGTIKKEPPAYTKGRLDPGPPYPGWNAHIVIDGVGYIFADITNYNAEARIGIGNENLAPMMGNPDNALDTQSSDLTLLLPIGQNDFSEGIGATDLERTPKGYERGENLMWTPQNTLINGPLITHEPFTGNPNPIDSRGYVEGYFGGAVLGGGNTANTYFGLGAYLYLRSNVNSNWGPLANANPITDIYGYSGRVIIGWGDSNGQMLYNSTAYPANFRIWRGFTLNSNPFIINKDGRIYAAFIDVPDNPTITDETGTDTNLLHYAYAVSYLVKLPDNSLYTTGLGSLGFASKLPNRELVITLPTRGYRGGPILRRLWRTTSNDLTNFYLIADETVLGPNATRWVDTMTDATAITKTAYDFTQTNDTGMMLLLAGEVNRNMQFPDTHPIWLSQKFIAPNTGDIVTKVVTFHDAQGNEGVAIGTTSGLFVWNGFGQDFQTIRLSFYHPLNFRYMAVNHGGIYYTMMGHSVYLWTPEKTTQIQGPWLVHFTHLEELRLTSNSNYVTIAAIGYNKYDGTGTRSCIVYMYDGAKFVWSHRFTQPNASTDWTWVTPVLGGIYNADMLAFFKGYPYAGIETMPLDPVYETYQTTGVLFRSAGSDGDLPRLRKQVHAVMVRYLRLTPQPKTTLSSIAHEVDTSITVANASIFAIGDWLCIEGTDLVKREYRKVASITGNVIGLSHALGSALEYDHAQGTTVARCGAVCTLRNVFTDAMSQQDIEVGGPCEAGELFAYIKLPVPVYTYSDGIELKWRDGTVMELIGWAMLTSLNPQWQGLMDLTIRLQDYTKLPNNLYDNALASERQTQLETAFNKGTIEVIDPLGNVRSMRFQRLSFSYEEPKERHADQEHMQATATVRLLDELAELSKQSELVLNIARQ